VSSQSSSGIGMELTDSGFNIKNILPNKSESILGYWRFNEAANNFS